MNLTKTRIPFLAALALLAGSFGWSLAHLWPHWFDVQMPVPAMNAVTMWTLSAVVLTWALIAKSKLQAQNPADRLPALVAARTAALAMAASRVGTLVLGFYIGLACVNLRITVTADVRHRLLVIALVIVAALILIIVALWLEHLCRIKQPPTSDETTAPAN
jgi:hypothetical protein